MKTNVHVSGGGDECRHAPKRPPPLALIAAGMIVLLGCSGLGTGLNSPSNTCPEGRTQLEGVCVSEVVADYVACVRAQGAQLAGAKHLQISADVGTAGVKASGAAQVSEALEKKYAGSDATMLEIVRRCNASVAPTKPSITQGDPSPSIVGGIAQQAPLHPTDVPRQFAGSFKWSNEDKTYGLRLSIDHLEETQGKIVFSGSHFYTPGDYTMKVNGTIEPRSRELTLRESSPSRADSETGGAFLGTISQDLQVIQAVWVTAATGNKGYLNLRAQRTK